MTKLHVTVTEVDSGWDIYGDSVFLHAEHGNEAAEMLAQLGRDLAPSILTVTWEPTTWIGRAVVKGLTE